MDLRMNMRDNVRTWKDLPLILGTSSPSPGHYSMPGRMCNRLTSLSDNLYVQSSFFPLLPLYPCSAGLFTSLKASQLRSGWMKGCRDQYFTSHLAEWVAPLKRCPCPNPWNLWSLPYLEKKVFVDAIRILRWEDHHRLSRWALSPMTIVFMRKAEGDLREKEDRKEKAMWKWRQRLE